MLSQEYRLKRLGLGIPHTKVAERFKVNIRTAQRWDRNIEPPENVQKWIQSQWEQRASSINEALNMMEDYPNIPLIRYSKEERCQAMRNVSLVEQDLMLAWLLMFNEVMKEPLPDIALDEQ